MGCSFDTDMDIRGSINFVVLPFVIFLYTEMYRYFDRKRVPGKSRWTERFVSIFGMSCFLFIIFTVHISALCQYFEQPALLQCRLETSFFWQIHHANYNALCRT